MSSHTFKNSALQRLLNFTSNLNPLQYFLTGADIIFVSRLSTETYFNYSY